MNKPKLFHSYNGLNIYHVHKDGYGEGRETTFWYSTSDSSEMVDTPGGLRLRTTKHEAKRFDSRRKFGMNPDYYIKEYGSDWLDYLEEDLKKKIEKAIDAGKLRRIIKYILTKCDPGLKR